MQQLKSKFELWAALVPLWFKLWGKTLYMHRASWRLIRIKTEGRIKGYYK